jgi:hypothetical protein
MYANTRKLPETTRVTGPCTTPMVLQQGGAAAHIMATTTTAPSVTTAAATCTPQQHELQPPVIHALRSLFLSLTGKFWCLLHKRGTDFAHLGASN